MESFKSFYLKNKSTKIVFVGDIMQHQLQIDYQKTVNFDYSEVFKEIKPIFDKADFVVGNFETNFADSDKIKQDKNGIYFTVPDEFANELKRVGFTHFGFSNNHVLDNGKDIYYRTIDILEKAGLKVINETTNKIGNFNIFAFTTHINLSKNNDDLKKELMKIPKTKDGFNIVFPHWGWQYTNGKNKNQIDTANLLKDFDLIVGSGPHEIQEIENNIVWSLGDFLAFHKAKEAKNEGLIVEVTIENNKLKNINKIEIYTNTEKNGKSVIKIKG